jgi:hypothetical protein
MSYSIEAEQITLNDLRKRIEATDLTPSRAALKVDINVRMMALERQGIATLAQLRYQLKNAKRLETLAQATAIDEQYLILLRREVEGYFPKPLPLSDFDWLPQEDIARLEQYGISNTAALYEATSDARRRDTLAKSAGIADDSLEMLAQLADLTRVQWVSPTVARMLVAAHYHNPAQVAGADANELTEALARVNAGGRFFKGKIGLRDVQRLIQAASYVS